MFDQVFALTDLPKIAFLSFLEIILSADNAIVLGLLAARLPEKQRAKALYIGLFSAFFIRAFTILLLGFFIRYRWIQLLGAAYLIFLSVRHFLKKKKEVPDSLQLHSFWKAVVMIEIFDIIFAIDSILAGVAFINSSNPQIFHSKLWIVYIGGMIGLIGIRFAAHLFTSLIAKFPNMENSAFLLIGWIAIKLIYEVFPHPMEFEHYFWGVFVLLFLLGFMKKKATH